VESVFTIPWKRCSPSRGIRIDLALADFELLHLGFGRGDFVLELWHLSCSLSGSTAHPLLEVVGASIVARSCIANKEGWEMGEAVAAHATFAIFLRVG
jgi:hypothetical protein